MDPPTELMEAQKEGGGVKIRQWDGVEGWVFTRYADVLAGLSDSRSSVDPSKPGFPEKSAAYGEVLGKDHTLRTLDGRQHAAQKRMLLDDFSAKRVEEMRPSIQVKVDSLIDEMIRKGSPAELVKDFALGVPTMIICEILGVPFKDREWFGELGGRCISSIVTAEEAATAGAQLYEYCDALMSAKEKAPQNDLTSRLVIEKVQTGLLSRKDAVELVRFILIAGHETSAHMIALSTLALLQNPDQAALLRDNNDRAFLTNAVDELFRYTSITHIGRRRVAVEDFKIGDQLVKAGEGMILMNNVGDRDEQVFPNADKLDLKRPNAKDHMAFGGGPHKCLGAALAKCELEVVHGTLWKRLPNLQLAVPFEELKFNETSSAYGVHALPVKWSL
jgi:hypothetical protein